MTFIRVLNRDYRARGPGKQLGTELFIKGGRPGAHSNRSDRGYAAFDPMGGGGAQQQNRATDRMEIGLD